MNGQQLYELWVAANLANNVGVDAWEDIGETDQDCWHTLAESLPS